MELKYKENLLAPVSLYVCAAYLNVPIWYNVSEFSAVQVVSGPS